MKVMKMSEPCLVKYVRCIGMPEVWRDHVRFVFNRTEGKLEVVGLKGIWTRENDSQNPSQIYSVAIGQLE
jgi:hypothetical protein